EGFQTGDIVADVGVDRSVLGIDGEQDGAFEAMMLGQDPGQLWQSLFRAIFLVAADQHYVFALAGAVEALVDDPRIGRPYCHGGQADPDNRQDHVYRRCKAHGGSSLFGRKRQSGKELLANVRIAWPRTFSIRRGAPLSPRGREKRMSNSGRWGTIGIA